MLLSVRVDEDLRHSLEEAAQASGLDISTFVRETLRGVVRPLVYQEWQCRRVHLSPPGQPQVVVEGVGIDAVYEGGIPVPTRSYLVVATHSFFDALVEEP